MTKQRLYHSNFNHHGHRRGKANRSRAHNLRAKAVLESLYTDKLEMNDICDFGLTKNNVLYIPDENGKLKLSNPEKGENLYNQITFKLDKEKKEYLANLESAFSDSNKAELSDKRAKAKAALKRYKDGSDGSESEFWQDLTDRLGSDEIDPETEIYNLKNCAAKIKRFNQKVQRLKELSDYNQLIGVKSRNTEYTVFSKELVYKFPDDTGLNVKPTDLANFVNGISKILYPDFSVNYLVVHLDENPDNPHAHIEYSGKNNQTGEMDIQQQVFLNLKRVYKKESKIFPFENINHYNDLTFTEVKKFGEVYQDYIFEKMNAFLKERKYEVNLEKRTAVEKLNDFEKFKDKFRPSQKREWTRAGKLKEQNKVAEEKLVETNENLAKNKTKIATQNMVIKSKKEEVEKIDIEIIDKVNILLKLNEKINDLNKKYEELKEAVKDALTSAYEYAVNDLKPSLFNYFKRQKQIKEIDSELGERLKNDAIDLQPNEEKKNAIKYNRN
ncbi:coiled-coil domain-containing protein [Vibrio porteresiae]|uniref:Uncharacterized protein n=1 Tax=Vibrio porteresiae DSM 19223 TaxID=1123496 RepID=A0ABZ0QCM7_9VIBR|nr:hypothetical protein [Vibrio porteresiae]WPC74155.1 hypothetical protein R8Z52_02470 [Vibrio porteresiae DSM 19223]WPC74648.1 hypothetical protein R8Z52_05365 [Vibrio porteresiae DSM 19223]